MSKDKTYSSTKSVYALDSTEVYVDPKVPFMKGENDNISAHKMVQPDNKGRAKDLKRHNKKAIKSLQKGTKSKTKDWIKEGKDIKKILILKEDYMRILKEEKDIINESFDTREEKDKIIFDYDAYQGLVESARDCWICKELANKTKIYKEFSHPDAKPGTLGGEMMRIGTLYYLPLNVFVDYGIIEHFEQILEATSKPNLEDNIYNKQAYDVLESL